MKIVTDTNVIIASLIKNGLARKIILDSKNNFICPSYTLSEIYKYKEEIMKKAGLNELEFSFLLYFIFQKIKIISALEYEDYLSQALNVLKDKKDAPFLALALSFNTEAIWSDDNHFKNQNLMRVLTTKEMISLT